MRKIGVFLLMLVCLLHCTPLISTAATEESITSGCSTLQAQYAIGGDEAYTGTADAALLYELETQTLVYAHNPDDIINPSGLVKIMTALIVLEEGDLGDMVTVERSTLNSVGSGSVSAGLQAGEMMSIRDLLYCMMVSSANDAAAVMAEHVAGSQQAFVDKMNEKAATLGCVNTHFANVHGLKNDSQCSTARELAIITEEALKNELFVQMFGLVNYQVPATNMSAARNLTTTNYMMDASSKKYYDERVTGGKPAAATTADRSVICTAEDENGRYLCVVISATAKTSGYSVKEYTNFTEAKSLLDLGFKGFAVQQVLGGDQPFGMYPVSNGENSVVVGADQDVYALLPVEFDRSVLQFRDVKDQQSLVAPLKKGTAVGTLQILYGDIVVGEVELLARHDVALAGTIIEEVQNESSIHRILNILKWMGIIILVLAVVLVAGLLVVRQANILRYQKRKKRQRSKQREGVNELE